MESARRAYPSDVTEEEWAFAAPYLTLMKEDAPQREHNLREVFNALRWITRTGAQWRFLPNDLPPWAPVNQQAQRWLRAGVFEAMAADLRAILTPGRRPRGTTHGGGFRQPHLAEHPGERRPRRL